MCLVNRERKFYPFPAARASGGTPHLRGLKDGEWLAWGPMHRWTDRKIRIHAFYCMLGISLLRYVHRQAKAAWSDLSMEQLIEELQQIQQFILLYRSIHSKARKALIARPMCSRNKLLRSRLWPRP
jgi:hypothetical protein